MFEIMKCKLYAHHFSSRVKKLSELMNLQRERGGGGGGGAEARVVVFSPTLKNAKNAREHITRNKII